MSGASPSHSGGRFGGAGEACRFAETVSVVHICLMKARSFQDDLPGSKHKLNITEPSFLCQACLQHLQQLEGQAGQRRSEKGNSAVQEKLASLALAEVPFLNLIVTRCQN